MKRNTSAGYSSFKGARFQLFTDADLHSIHLATLEILERTGLNITDEEALEYFERNGARVDHKKKVVKIPAWMVEDAIKSSPASVFLAGKEAKYDIILEDGRVYVCPFGLGILIEDPYTGELRETTKQDIADCARLVDYLDEYDFVFDTMVARDVDPRVACIHGFEAPLINTNKPVLASPENKTTAKIQLEMGAVAAGGMDKLSERPIMMLGGCTISPLTIPESTVAAVMEAARARVPSMILSMAMSGGMAPVTLAGALVVMNAESLGALTLSQLVNKGTPFVYGSSTGTLDMRHKAAAMLGCPETGLINAGVASIARQYNIPTLVAGG
jgi:trimethylamine--corrinoid protein Co-methyltransferase